MSGRATAARPTWRAGAWIALLGLLLGLGLTAASVEARLGGGHSFSGGGSSRSSGGGSSFSGGGFSGGGFSSGGFSGGPSYVSSSGGRGTPLPGGCVTILVIVFVVFVIASVGKSFLGEFVNYSSTTHRPLIEHRAPPPEVPRGSLTRLRQRDPYFSEPVFLDFVCALYGRLHEARGRGELATFHFYLGPAAEEALAGLTRGGLIEVSGVIVGSARLVAARPGDAAGTADAVDVHLEANYTEVWPGAVDVNSAAFGKGDRRRSAGRVEGDPAKRQLMTFYVNEVWTFSRRAGLVSRPPEQVSVEACPNCGSPLTRGSDERCGHCGAPAVPGTFAWAATEIKTLSRARMGPTLTETVQEVGTDLPTVRQHDLAARWQDYLARHPGTDWAAVRQRFETVFYALQRAWTERDWTKARPYETDAMFQTHLYWIEEYRRQDLRNVLDKITLEHVELVKVDADAFYDAVTVRMHASMIDATVRPDGTVVTGDLRRPRRFTEYWTFLRRQGPTPAPADAKAAPDATSGGPPGTKAGADVPEEHAAALTAAARPACPHCGAPLTITQAGVCEYCQTKITLGQFDWVLSRIEQDETYRG